MRLKETKWFRLEIEISTKTNIFLVVLVTQEGSEFRRTILLSYDGATELN